MGEANFQRVLKFVHNIINGLEFVSGKTQIAVLTYSDDTIIWMNFGHYTKKKDILEVVDRIAYTGGGTFTADALKVLRERVFNPDLQDRPSAPDVAILITDGVSNILPQRTIPEAHNTHAAGIHVYGVGVALNDSEELAEVVSDKQSLFLINNYHELVEFSANILDIVCSIDESAHGLAAVDPAAGYTLDTPPDPGKNVEYPLNKAIAYSTCL